MKRPVILAIILALILFIGSLMIGLAIAFYYTNK